VLKLGIAGICGRMGTRICELALQDGGFEVIYGLEADDSKKSKDGIPTGADTGPLEKADVVVDFTIASATAALLPVLRGFKVPCVIGTTGFSADQEKTISAIARELPVVKAPNMSLGVNVFFRIAAQTARALPSYDVKIVETHHVHKKDKPSGTALYAGSLIEQATGRKVSYECHREGEVVGDHQVIFTGPADRLEIFHHAESRDILAAGALQAAKWIVGKKPGLYNMHDVLEMK